MSLALNLSPGRVVKGSKEYQLVGEFYANRVAERSQIPLMNHINEGLAILEAIGATTITMRAFCLHPLFQHDNDLMAQGLPLLERHAFPLPVVLLVMEYRNQANRWLSNRVGVAELGKVRRVDSRPTPGPIPEVRQMLIADKVQNRKDFLAKNGNIANATELRWYFEYWMTALGLDSQEIDRLTKVCEDAS